MQIDRVLFPITTLGPGNRIGIWTIGCPWHCFKCTNPELWNADESREVNVSDLVSNILPYRYKTDGITITGGDPFFQPDELYMMLKALKTSGFEDILVYTGYKYDVVKEKYPSILMLIDVLIDGKYIDNLNNDMGIMGSANQHIIILNKALTEKYKGLSKVKRYRQNFIFSDKILSVGIPNKST